MARYVCSACGFVYDEEQEDISWEDLPEDWFCPGCGADKSLFQRMNDDDFFAIGTKPFPSIAPLVTSNGS